MFVHIVGAGPFSALPNLEIYKDQQNIYWIGVDRGGKYLHEYGITPNLMIGDFDSIDSKVLQTYKNNGIHFKTFASEKDETDMELAFCEAQKMNPKLIRIFGATGGRLDHLLGNIQMLVKFIDTEIPVQIIDNQNCVEVKKPGSYSIKQSEYKYVSFIPITNKIENLTLIGFKYPLKDCHIFLGSTLCISNELIFHTGTYSFTNGILLVIQAKD